ncbi:MAG: hypothetical protein ACK521_03710 [bacterium]|jgi:hypothetical protein
MADVNSDPKTQETFPKDENKWNSEDLMKLQFSIFRLTESSHAISNCLFTFLKYIQSMERLLDEDGFEIATKFVAKMINFNGEVVV